MQPLSGAARGLILCHLGQSTVPVDANKLGAGAVAVRPLLAAGHTRRATQSAGKMHCPGLVCEWEAAGRARAGARPSLRHRVVLGWLWNRRPSLIW